MLPDPFKRGSSGKAVLLSQILLLAMLNELVGPARSQHRRAQPLPVHLFQHSAAKAPSQHMVLERHQEFS